MRALLYTDACVVAHVGNLFVLKPQLWLRRHRCHSRPCTIMALPLRGKFAARHTTTAHPHSQVGWLKASWCGLLYLLPGALHSSAHLLPPRSSL